MDPQISVDHLLQGISATVPDRPRRVAMVGLGRLQLGLVGPVFSSLGYQLSGINLKSDEVVRSLNQHHYYRVIDRPPHGGTDIEIGPVHRFDPESVDSEESRAAIEVAADAQVINCGLGTSEAGTAHAARFLLEVEKHRRRNALIDPLYITCSDNPVGTTFGIEFIQRGWQGLTYSLPVDERIALWNDVSAHVRFLPSLADRICSARIIDHEKGIRPVHILAETYGEFALGRSFLSVQPLAPKNTNSLGEIRIWDNLEVARQRKLYTLSMAHAIAAYLGAFDPSRPQTIAQALKSRRVSAHVERSLEEVAAALAIETGESETDWLQYASSALQRISNPFLDDPIPRVARDAPRKLNRSDRLIGPLLLSLRTRFRVSESLKIAVLHALLYAYAYGREILEYEDDAATKALGDLLRSRGPEHALETVSGLNASDPAESELIVGIATMFRSATGKSSCT